MTCCLIARRCTTGRGANLAGRPWVHVARALAAGSLLLLLILTLALPTTVFAYERRSIGGGKYDVVVGWDAEPPLVGQRNAASIRITRAGTNPAQPVDGAEQTLRVQIAQGDQSKDFALRAVVGQRAYYVADFVPTRVGDYQWTFTGNLEGTAVNEVFTSADGKFEAVGSAADVAFPPGPPQGTAEGDALNAAQASAASARTLAIAGLAIGALGLLIALAAWLRQSRGQPRMRSRRY